MNFLELTKERYSVRKFSDREVEQEKIDKILEAAKNAPTATNAQPQRIYIIQNESMEKLKECTTCTFGANMAILVCYNKDESWKRDKFDGEDSGILDAAIVGTHIMLEIVEQGLGSTWVGYFDPEKIVELFDIPENIIPKALFPLGYPAEDSEPSERHFKRKNIEEIVKYI
ncbi:MAG: nitroreductase family protein [Andreesenia angusta]|nr:nitroreductase family protein [Andreesenia angusta]